MIQQALVVFIANLQVGLVLLRITGKIDWPFWLVMSPFLLPIVVFVAFMLVVFLTVKRGKE